MGSDHRRRTVLAAAALSVFLITTGCGGPSDDSSYTPPAPENFDWEQTAPEPEAAPEPATAPEAEPAPELATAPEPVPASGHISGHVSRSTGEPYPDVWVEFRTVFGGNVHTTTDANGNYELPVPDGVYTALAGANDDPGVSFDVVGADNVVEVPGDARVDFVAADG